MPEGYLTENDLNEILEFTNEHLLKRKLDLIDIKDRTEDELIDFVNNYENTILTKECKIEYKEFIDYLNQNEFCYLSKTKEKYFPKIEIFIIAELSVYGSAFDRYSIDLFASFNFKYTSAIIDKLAA